MNHADIARYFSALDAGEYPVERSFHYSNEHDFRLTLLFQMLISLVVDRAVYRSATGDDVANVFAAAWDALTEQEWVCITPDRVELIGDGVFYTPLIQSLLARERVNELRKNKVVPLRQC